MFDDLKDYRAEDSFVILTPDEWVMLLAVVIALAAILYPYLA